MLGSAFALVAFSAAAGAESSSSETEVIRGPYLVADAATGQVIEASDAVRPWYPASTTKLMTIYVAFEAIRAGEITLDTEIKYSKVAAAQPASKMGFKRNATFSLDNALKMMMVKSANDVAVSVAEAVAGSVDAFSERMNAAAADLGMTHSHFVNPHGLPDERQVTSARDMAVLARALLRTFPEHRPYYNIHAIQIGGKVLRNYNRLIDRFPGTTGMKTGFICSSGYNLVASARRDGRELIAVVFGAYGGQLRNEQAAALLHAAFASPSKSAESPITLDNVFSGSTYAEPLDMRPYVCGKQRKAMLAALAAEEDAAEDTDEPASHLTARIDLGPPLKVSAVIPAEYGEPGFVARLPRARPGSADGPPEILPAFAPLDESASTSPPAEAIGAAAGQPRPLQDIKSQ